MLFFLAIFSLIKIINYVFDLFKFLFKSQKQFFFFQSHFLNVRFQFLNWLIKIEVSFGSLKVNFLHNHFFVLLRGLVYYHFIQKSETFFLVFLWLWGLWIKFDILQLHRNFLNFYLLTWLLVEILWEMWLFCWNIIVLFMICLFWFWVEI